MGYNRKRYLCKFEGISPEKEGKLCGRRSREDFRIQVHKVREIPAVVQVLM